MVNKNGSALELHRSRDHTLLKTLELLKCQEVDKIPHEAKECRVFKIDTALDFKDAVKAFVVPTATWFVIEGKNPFKIYSSFQNGIAVVRVCMSAHAPSQELELLKNEFGCPNIQKVRSKPLLRYIK